MVVSVDPPVVNIKQRYICISLKRKECMILGADMQLSSAKRLLCAIFKTQ
jgi:hypothetical protein